MKPSEVDKLLNQKSGLLGLSGISSDMRDLHQSKNPRAKLTIQTLAYQIAKYIGAYAAALHGLDALIFTGGMGEKAFYLRSEICDYLEHLGVKLDPKRNAAAVKFEKNPTAKNATQAEEISPTRAKIRVFVIPANEALEMAREIGKL